MRDLRWGCAVSAIRIADLLAVYQDITEVMEGIDKCMDPGPGRAIAWKKLSDSRCIIRAAIEQTGIEIEVKEAA